MSNKITCSAAEYLGILDLGRIDDYISASDLTDHRDEILRRMRLAVQVINGAAVGILEDLYDFAAEHHSDLTVSGDLARRTSALYNHLDDAIAELHDLGFFKMPDEEARHV